jgi:peptidoglycan/xylan/chitin deacetylase (PgdA/CDA1 family)
MITKLLTGIIFLIPITLIKAQDTLYVAKYQSNKQCAISYTFDDGLLEHYTLVFPKFEKLGFKATFWVNGKSITEGEQGLQTKTPRATWDNLKTMAAHGQEISNHGWSHKNLVRFPLEEGRIDIERNDSAIWANIGERPITYCYPNNSKSPEAIKMASENRVGTRTKQFSLGSKATPENLDRRIDTLLATSDWGVAMTHGINYGYDAFKNDTVFWNHLDKVKTLENKIWVATFRDVAAYTAEQQNVKLDVNKKKKKWLVKPIFSLDKKLFKFPLTMVLIKKDTKKVSAIQNGKNLKVEVKDGKTMFDFDPNGGKIKITIE